MKFFEGGIRRLVSSILTKSTPAYVQFYVTARCNLACEQCNIIYANADQEEVSIDECRQIAMNLAKIGTSVVLLTGGEPFMRRDLPQICKIFLENGIHPRIQSNGYVKREQLEAVATVGVKDISVSLDSLVPNIQNSINGGYAKSWEKAIQTVAMVNEIFPRDGFASFGCVLSPNNLDHIPDVVRFATEIGWWVSLVPIHTTSQHEPRNFRTFDQTLQFEKNELKHVKDILEQVKELRDSGSNVYDSDEYLNDIFRFVSNQPIQWRRRNGGVCDSPYLYFIVQPNGDMAVCCDYRFPESYSIQSPDFPALYRSRRLREQAAAITNKCEGCMYGSFPEITVTSRFFMPMIRRAHLFLLNSNRDRQLKAYPVEKMKEIAANIVNDRNKLNNEN